MLRRMFSRSLLGTAATAFGVLLGCTPASAAPYDGIIPGVTSEPALMAHLARRRGVKIEDRQYQVGRERWYFKLGFSPDGRSPGRVVLGLTIRPVEMGWDEFVGKYGEPDASYSKWTPWTKRKFIQCEYANGVVACLSPSPPHRVLAYGFTRPGELFDSLWSAYTAIDDDAKGR